MNKKDLQSLLGMHVRKSEWAQKVRAHSICVRNLQYVERGIETLDALGLNIDEFKVGELDKDKLPLSWHKAARRGTDERSNLKCMIYRLHHVCANCGHQPFRTATLSEALVLMNDVITFGGRLCREQAVASYNNPIEQKINDVLGRKAVG